MARYRAYHVLQWLCFILFAISSEAVDVFSRFRVEQGIGPVTRSGSGTYGGTCYGIDADLNAIYAEAIDMAQVALNALNNYATSPTVRASVETFFGIRADTVSTTVVSAAHSSYFTTMKGWYEKIIADSNNVATAGGEPGLFCDESWRWKTTIAYGPDGSPTGETVFENTGGQNTFYYWSPLYKKKTGTTIRCSSPNTLAYAMKDPPTITFCPASFTWPKRKDSLSAWRSRQQTIADGTPLRAALSTPYTFLHELCHLVSRRAIVDVPMVVGGVSTTAYGPQLVSQLAASLPDWSIKNADSYAWFAVAMYLDQCDWSRLVCAQAGTPSAITARSHNQTSEYMSDLEGWRRRTFFSHPEIVSPNELQEEALSCQIRGN